MKPRGVMVWVLHAVLAVVSMVAVQAKEFEAGPSPLLAIDRNREAVVERIVAQWGDALARAGAGITAEHLREMLLGMRADQLFAASLVGSLEGLRNVIAAALVSESEVKPSLLQAKALGDGNQDVVYVPVTPCRLVETRGTFAAVYQGGGAFTTNEIRTYTLQGGNGVCLSQLPASISPSAVQMQVYGIPTTTGSGDIEILPQGGTFGSTATLVYLGNNAFTSASSTSLANLANKQISVQVRGGGAHVAIDVVGYFRAPAGGFVSSITAGAGLTGGTITSSGTIAVDTATIQSRVTGTCAAGSSIRAIAANGTVTCETDDVGTGTVTSVATGAGLTGGPIVTSGTIGLASTQLLPTVACTNGQVPQWNGSAWACATTGSFTGNVNLPNSTSSAVGNITKPGGAFLHNFGSSNTFAGVNAGNFTMAGTGNAALGTLALTANNTGSNNTASGALALSANTTGNDNTATGTFALGASTTGDDNTAAGSGALLTNTLGNRNTALGRNALASNTTGNNNVAVGKDAAGQNTSGANNVAVGIGALLMNNAGSGNTAVGASALSFSVGDGNSAFGLQALELNTTGQRNTAVGVAALNANSIGFSNTGLGLGALQQGTTGFQNTAVGTFAMYSITTGYNNTAIGSDALRNISDGSSNVAVGLSVGSNLTSGSENIYISHYGPFGGIESQTTRLGQAQKRAFIAGIRGITTGVNDAVAVVIDSAGQLGTLSSSRKVKDDVADMGDASDVLMKLHPVTFRYKTHQGAGPVQYGLIAEEVADIAPGLVATGRNGDVETVYYQHLAPMLLNEYQKQQRTIDAQARRIDAQQLEIAELRRAVEVLFTRTSPEGRLATQ
ncbi:MAG: tail fiber domain-containing protein [Burkholderiales bacterium]